MKKCFHQLRREELARTINIIAMDGDAGTVISV